MAEQDARVQEIREWAARALAEKSAADVPLAVAADTVFLLARLDVLRVARDIARRVEQESSAAADAWQAEAVKVRGERDALAARLAAAESARDAAEQIIADVQFDLINCHQQNACAHIQDALMIVNRHGAVLAGSREQAGEGA